MDKSVDYIHRSSVFRLFSDVGGQAVTQPNRDAVNAVQLI
jgi:hypothetical protein